MKNPYLKNPNYNPFWEIVGFILLFALLIAASMYFSSCSHSMAGLKVTSTNPASRNFGEIGIVHAVGQDRWGNDSWAWVDYDSTGPGLKGEMLAELVEVDARLEEKIKKYQQRLHSGELTQVEYTWLIKAEHELKAPGRGQ